MQEFTPTSFSFPILYLMIKQKTGTITIPPGVFPDRHEKMTADFLAEKLGFDVVFLVPARRANTRTPDIRMAGVLWEIKSPKGSSSRTIENNLRNALLQSSHIIVDLRRIDERIPTYKLTREIEKRFRLSKKMKRVIVITRQQNIIDVH